MNVRHGNWYVSICYTKWKNIYSSNKRLWSKVMYFNTFLICKEMLVYTVRHQLVKINTSTTRHRRKCLKRTKRCSDILIQHFCISKSKNSQKRLWKSIWTRRKGTVRENEHFSKEKVRLGDFSNDNNSCRF